MIFPFDSLTGANREVGMVVAVAIGFGFGFVLERAGFGRATKLAAQFYGRDMTVFKVMFGAIVTAMLGLVIASGAGLVDLKALSEGAASWTFVWPMLIGGLLLGVGFITSGYCPGTSMVATASGNVDGLVTFTGVIVGTLVYGEVYPAIEGFATSGEQGHLFLYDVFGVSPAVLAVLIALMAVGMFLGAEIVERKLSKPAGEGDHLNAPAAEPRRRRLAFGVFGTASALAVVFLVVPVATSSAADAPAAPEGVTVEALAQRVFESPWTVRVVDLRAQEACAKERIPGAECAPLATLGDLGLKYDKTGRTLVLVADGDLAALPPAALQFPGHVHALAGGFAAWKAFALSKPEPLTADATPAEREAFALRAGVSSALTGKAPPPPPAAKKFVPKKKKGGGCS